MGLTEYLAELGRNTKAKEEADREVKRLQTLLYAAHRRRDNLDTDRLNLKRMFFGQAYAADSKYLNKTEQPNAKTST
jgi:hypothetical protein